MTSSPSRQSVYNLSKRIRQARQLTHYEECAGQPLADRMRAWRLHWPHRVPKIVWARMSSHEHLAWLTGHQASRLRQLIDQNPTSQPVLLRWRIQALAEKAVQVQASPLTDLCAVINKIKGPLAAIVHFSVRALADPSASTPTSFVGQYVADEKRDWGADAPSLRMALALGLEDEGSVVIRQQLPLRAQRRQPDGSVDWVHQERAYGIRLNQGNWESVSAEEVRQAYAQRDIEDPAAPAGAALSYGEFQSLVEPSHSINPSANF